MQELRKTESSLRTERDQWRDQATANKHEVEKLRGIFNWTVVFGVSEIWIWVPFTLCRRNLKNRGLILKTHQLKIKIKLKIENTITGHFGFLFEENSVMEITWLSWRLRFQKAQFSKMFSVSPHYNAKPPFSNSFGLNSVFEKLRFCDGLLWVVGLTIEIKLRFKYLRRGVKRALNLHGHGIFDSFCFFVFIQVI